VSIPKTSSVINFDPFLSFSGENKGLDCAHYIITYSWDYKDLCPPPRYGAAGLVFRKTVLSLFQPLGAQRCLVG